MIRSKPILVLFGVFLLAGVLSAPLASAEPPESSATA